MSATPVSIADLIGIISAGQEVVPASTGGKESFHALLDLGGKEIETPEDSGRQSTQDRRKNARLPDMAAAPAELSLTATDVVRYDEPVKAPPDVVVAENIDESISENSVKAPYENSSEDTAQAVEADTGAAPAQTPVANASPVSADDGAAPVETAAPATVTVTPFPIIKVPQPIEDIVIPQNPFPGRQWLGGMGRLRQTLAGLAQALMQQFNLGKSPQQQLPPGAPDPFAALIAAIDLRLGGGLPHQVSASPALATPIPADQLPVLRDLLEQIRGGFAALVKSMPPVSTAAIDDAAAAKIKPAQFSLSDLLGRLETLEKNLNKLNSYLAHLFPGAETKAATLIADALSRLDHLQKSLQLLPPTAIDLPAPADPIIKTPKLLSAFASADDSSIPTTLAAPAKSATTPMAAPTLPVTAQQADTTTPANINAQAQISGQPQAVAPIAGTVNGETQGNTGGNAQNNNGNAPLPTPSISAGPGSSSAPGTAGATFARMLTQAPHSPAVEQVVLHIRAALSDGSSRIRIQLDPEELGKMDIRLHVAADGKTGVQVTVDNKDTLLMLQRDSRGLEQALADAGLKADGQSLSFNLRGGEREQNDPSQAALTYRKYSGEEEEIPAALLAGNYVINLAEGLDIVI